MPEGLIWRPGERATAPVPCAGGAEFRHFERKSPMEFGADDVRASIMYQHLIRLIVPRPIAWVSTVSTSGVTNLAPFSFFTGVGSRPPSLLFCPANRRDGTEKDTLRNIRESGEFVVNVVPFAMAELMNQTSAELSDTESEFDNFGISTAESRVVRCPRVLGSPAGFECRLMKLIPVEPGPGGANIVVGRIVHVHLSDMVLDAQGLADSGRLDAIGRMGGAAYCRTGDLFELPRPD